MSNGIPKLVMQTWKTTTVPKEWQVGQESVQRILSDWTYVYMTDEDNSNFVHFYFPEHEAAFNALPYNIQRADVIRYMWLYVHGGLYLDMDYQLLADPTPMWEALQASVFVLHSPNVQYVLTNSLILAKPNCTIFLSLISKALYRTLPFYYVGKHIQVMFSTGPMVFHETVVHSDEAFVVLPRGLFFPTDNRAAYARPLVGQSWNAYDSFMLNFMLKYRTELALCVGALVLFMTRGFFQYRQKVMFLLRHISRRKRKE